jgi:hypothetical protein
MSTDIETSARECQPIREQQSTSTLSVKAYSIELNGIEYRVHTIELSAIDCNAIKISTIERNFQNNWLSLQ